MNNVQKNNLDFDNINQFKSKTRNAEEDLQQEIQLLQTILDYLRAGRINELQECLLETGQSLKYMHLIGNTPFFDNLRHEMQQVSGDMFLEKQNIEKQ